MKYCGFVKNKSSDLLEIYSKVFMDNIICCPGFVLKYLRRKTIDMVATEVVMGFTKLIYFCVHLKFSN